MMRQARTAGSHASYAAWIEHFEQNGPVHDATDAAIAFDAACRLSPAERGPFIDSVRRFQLGESGDGAQLLDKAAAAGDPDYLVAARRFVAEEQQHAALLLRLLGYLGGTALSGHWSDAAFVRLRRLMGLRTELMVLMVAEVVALSYYSGLADSAADPVVRATAARIVADERAHVRFHQQRLRDGFADARPSVRSLAFVFWWLTAIGATVVVAWDHRKLLTAIGYRRARFVRDVLADFARIVRTVLARRP